MIATINIERRIIPADYIEVEAMEPRRKGIFVKELSP